MGRDAEEPRSLSKELRAGPHTSAEARWFLAEALRNLGAEVDRDAAILLTSELASNAARHGREPIDLTISVEEEDLRVSILDRGSGFDPAALREQGAISGLRIVEELSSDWGVDRNEDGTEVWFRI